MAARSSSLVTRLHTLLSNREVSVLVALVLMAFVLRLYKFSQPIADWHSFRQVDTASVTREYVKHEIDLLRPRYHDLSNIQSGVRVGGADNIEGWRMVEFPFLNAAIALVLKTFPSLPFIETNRAFSILASLGTLVSLYYLTKHFFNQHVAFLSALTFAVLPYSVFYSRVVLPEPFMLFFSTLSLLGFSLWLDDDKWKWYFVSAISLALALLLKPFVLFLAPVYATIFIIKVLQSQKLKESLMFNGLAILPFLSISLSPFLWWRNWIQQFPSGIPASDWLFNSDGIRFRPAWFRWLGYERVVRLLVGYIGIVFIPFAFLPRDIWDSRQPKSLKKLLASNSSIFIVMSWWFGIFAYFIVIATGNVRHDYYQNLLLPIISITIGLGMLHLGKILTAMIARQKTVAKKFGADNLAFGIILTLYALMLIFSWQHVKGYFNINHWEYVHTGAEVDKILPSDAKVIAPAMGDTVFLFQTNRTGWPIGFDIDTKRENGAQYYVTTSYDDEARALEAIYPTIAKTDMYLILDLRTPLPISESQ